jgi:hypothetical protein
MESIKLLLLHLVGVLYYFTYNNCTCSPCCCYSGPGIFPVLSCSVHKHNALMHEFLWFLLFAVISTEWTSVQTIVLWMKMCLNSLSNTFLMTNYTKGIPSGQHIQWVHSLFWNSYSNSCATLWPSSSCALRNQPIYSQVSVLIQLYIYTCAFIYMFWSWKGPSSGISV